jgi:hypothetical protein
LIYPKGRGTVIVKAKRINRFTVTLELKDVFHIPDILFNLFSRTTIRKHKCYVYKRTDTVQKLNSNKVIAINVVNKTLFLRTKRLIAIALGSTDKASKANLQT